MSLNAKMHIITYFCFNLIECASLSYLLSQVFFFLISFRFYQVQPAVTDRAVQLERKEMDDSFVGSGLFHPMC